MDQNKQDFCLSKPDLLSSLRSTIIQKCKKEFFCNTITQDKFQYQPCHLSSLKQPHLSQYLDSCTFQHSNQIYFGWPCWIAFSTHQKGEILVPDDVMHSAFISNFQQVTSKGLRVPYHLWHSFQVQQNCSCFWKRVWFFHQFSLFVCSVFLPLVTIENGVSWFVNTC